LLPQQNDLEDRAHMLTDYMREVLPANVFDACIWLVMRANRCQPAIL